MKNSIMDKKIMGLMMHKEKILEMMETYKDGLKEVEIQDDHDVKVVEGRDIDVCIRARPLLQYELDQEYFEVTHAQNPNFHFMEIKLDLK